MRKPARPATDAEIRRRLKQRSLARTGFTRLPPRIQQLILSKQSLRLDLGCGPNKQPGPDVLGIDARDLPGVDIVHNLEEFPWPLPDSRARVAFLSHFWEHVDPGKTLAFMAELHRVLMHDGQVLISGPYGMEFRYVQDPTHRNPSNEATFLYWDKLHPSGLWGVYEPPVFHLESFEVIPAGPSRDFNAILRCCKATDADCRESHESAYART